MSCFASYNLQTSVLNGMTEDNKTFSFYLSNVTTNVPCIVCNVFVNRVCLHAYYYLCYVGFKSSSELMVYIPNVPTLNNTFDVFLL